MVVRIVVNIVKARIIHFIMLNDVLIHLDGDRDSEQKKTLVRNVYVYVLPQVFCEEDWTLFTIFSYCAPTISDFVSQFAVSD